MKTMSIEDRLYLCSYRRHNVPHIKVERRICNEKCKSKVCMTVCPAGSYELDAANNIVVHHENCLECGSCRIVCPENNVDWGNPVFGKGVVYKYG